MCLVGSVSACSRSRAEVNFAAADYIKPFKLCVNAPDVSVGSVLMQTDTFGIENPIAYFSEVK